MSADRQSRTAQLALAFPLSSRSHFDTFEVGANLELVRRLQDLDAGDRSFHGYYLHGEPGVGRTHLLQAACHQHGGRGDGIYLPLGDRALTPALLENLDERHLVALDDLQAWLGDPDAERALLDLYQGLHAAGGRLLVSAATPPAALEFALADLASRVRGLAVYRVQALDDLDKARVLTRLAGERGLILTAPVADFWLRRSSRDLKVLLAQLELLDAAAMAAQRRLTIPLLKDVLGL